VRDRRLLYVAAFLRSLATGTVGVLLGIHLSKLGFGAAAIGVVVGSGLAGAAIAALLVTIAGDRVGRRKALIALSLLGAGGGLVAAGASGLGTIAAAAFVGMLNGMGRDRGAALILDQAVLPATGADRDRTTLFAWYNVLQDAGHALGALLAGAPAVLRAVFAVEEIFAFRLTIVGYSCVLALVGVVYTGLSREVETPDRDRRPSRVSPETRRVVWRISSLFALDSLAGGLLTTALLAFFFYERFGAGEVTVGLLFFGARAANAASHLGAAWLARRIGLVNTMVFTHIPSSLLLLSVPFAPSFPVAAAMFLLREGLVEMDVPTRQSYVMAMIRPEERTFASGVTHLVRLGSWAVAPAFAGLLMTGVAMGTPLVLGAAMKIGYDLLLYAGFRNHRPPEERG